MEISVEAFSALLRAYDEFDSAAASILTAQPRQMTEAAARLDAARDAMWMAWQGTVRTIRKDAGATDSKGDGNG